MQHLSPSAFGFLFLLFPFELLSGAPRPLLCLDFRRGWHCWGRISGLFLRAMVSCSGKGASASRSTSRERPSRTVGSNLQEQLAGARLDPQKAAQGHFDHCVSGLS